MEFKITDPRLANIVDKYELDQNDLDAIFAEVNEIAEMIGPVNCKELQVWMRTRRLAIEAIKEQPYFKDAE